MQQHSNNDGQDSRRYLTHMMFYPSSDWEENFESHVVYIESIHTQSSEVCNAKEAQIGNLRFDDGNVNDNATNQWFDWLNEEK